MRENLHQAEFWLVELDLVTTVDASNMPTVVDRIPQVTPSKNRERQRAGALSVGAGLLSVAVH